MSSPPGKRLRRRLGRGVLRRLGWAVGAPVAAFRFLRRQVPLVEVDPADAGGALPPEDQRSPDRELEGGVGPVLHRTYTATIRTPRLTAARLVAVIAADPNVIAPSEVLRFEKTRGAPGRLEAGDELLIRMAGPWNAPVRVVRRWDEGFRLAARREHPQLGQFEFRARDENGDIAVEIQTRERAAGVAFHLLRRIGLIGRMQSYTWAEMLENAAQLAGGRRLDRIAIASWPGADASARGPAAAPEVQIGENARRGLTGPRRRFVDVAGFGVGAVLAAVAAVRRGKAVHPRGEVYEAELVVPRHVGDLGRTELFGTPATRSAVVRFSRSLGLPRPLPDLLGMSLRVLDAYGAGDHQDFLMVSSVDAPLLHHIFVPASDVDQRPYSSSLPYRAGGRTFLVGAVPRAADATGALVFDLAVADVWGRFQPVAEVRVGDPLPPEADALPFNPWNTGGGLEPAGFLNRLRDISYPMSQRAWGRAGRAGDQGAARTAISRSGGTARA